MRTELDVVTLDIQPGEKIQVHEVQILNNHLHAIAYEAARAIMGLAEMPSSNSVAGMSARDAGNINKGFAVIMEMFDQAKTWRTLAESGGHEDIQFINLPTPNQVASIHNERARRLANAYRKLAYYCLNVDSAKLEYEISEQDVSGIEMHLGRITSIIETFIGKVDPSGAYTRGMEMPVLNELGTVEPSVNTGTIDVAEPSTGAPDAAPHPDVADVDSAVPHA